MDQADRDTNTTNVDQIPIHHSTSPPPYPGPPVTHPQVLPGQVNVTQPGVVLIAQQMGPDPAIIVCNTCNEQSFTRIDQRPTMRTHLTAILLFVIGCWPFVFIPYCVNSCLQVDHYCTKCGAYIGSYHY
ncbi:lipopolysaccharide-induced tumor necrosis factor-alpha factor homolog [Aphomia sociella]